MTSISNETYERMRRYASLGYSAERLAEISNVSLFFAEMAKRDPVKAQGRAA